MPLLDHLEELRQGVLRSLLAVVIAAGLCLLAVKPLVRLLEAPAGPIHFLQLAPGEFLFVSLKVAGYAGLTLALPYVLYQGLAFILPGLTIRERRLIAPAVAGSAVLFLLGLAFAWWALVPALVGVCAVGLLAAANPELRSHLCPHLPPEIGAVVGCVQGGKIRSCSPKMRCAARSPRPSLWHAIGPWRVAI